jgi:sugar/nucleoside kinase (ribokinase family)
MLFTDDGLFLAPAFPLETIRDPTGAGDSFAGGMIGFLHRSGGHDERTLRRAVVMGSVIASFAVEDFSLDRFRTLTHDEIQTRFERFSELTRFDGDISL